MKHFSARYRALFAIGILLCVQLGINAQTLLRITITHQGGNYTWHQNTIKHLQKVIESIAPSHLEAKLLHIEHTREGNKITFDINQRGTKTIGNTVNTILSEVKQVAYIISNRLHKALQEVINIPYDLFIYYNPAENQSIATSVDDESVTTQSDDATPDQADVLTQEEILDPIIAIITPNTSSADTNNSLVENIDAIATAIDNQVENTCTNMPDDSLESIELIATIEESSTQQSIVVE